MIAEIGAGIGSLKAALDIAKGLNAIADTVALNDAKIALQGAIIEAQSSLLAAQEAQAANLKRIDELEARIVQLYAWEGEKQRYELKRYWPGAVAYTLKADMAAGEPTHSLCANCYQQGKKAILQATAEIRSGYMVHRCPSCKSDATLGDEMEDDRRN